MALLGIDIGGTKLALALGDADGEPLRAKRLPMSLSGDVDVDLATMGDAIEAFLGEGEGPPPDGLTAIGASVPGPSDPVRGILINPPNLPGWSEVPIGPWLAERFSVPATIDSDANAAALAEARFGAGRGIEDVVYLTMSTGVGAGVIAGGRIVRGAFGAAGEAGHMAIVPEGRRCACGLTGCFEAYCGGNAWRDRLRAAALADGRMAELAGGVDAISPVHAVAAAQEGDAEARGALAVWVEDLARGIAPIVMLVEPRRIVLGTIAVAAGEALCFAPLREALRGRLWDHQLEQLEIVPAELGEALPERAGLAVALSAASEAE